MISACFSYVATLSTCFQVLFSVLRCSNLGLGLSKNCIETLIFCRERLHPVTLKYNLSTLIFSLL